MILTAYYDPKLKLNGAEPAAITKQERVRISCTIKIVQTAQAIPRRLGPEASTQDMSDDRRRCRRVVHALQQPLEAWGGFVDTGDLSAEAAQLDWEKWAGEEQTYLHNRMRLVATLGINFPEHLTWAKQAFTRLQNEARWVQHALR